MELFSRDHTTWGKTFCVRDHYYQLWDLESNFGEKTQCTESVPNGMNVNMQLEQGLLGATAPRMLGDDEDWEENNDPRASLLSLWFKIEKSCENIN